MKNWIKKKLGLISIEDLTRAFESIGNAKDRSDMEYKLKIFLFGKVR